MSEPPAILEIQKHLRAIYDGRLNIYPSKATYLEVMDKAGSKENAVKFVSQRMGLKPEEIIAAWSAYRAEPQELKLPSAPKKPVVYVDANDRPQPRFDVDMGAGMSAVVGRLRPCGVLDWKFTVLSHNTIRGAAGAAVLNAELLKAKGYLG